jgi:hypothetical protein
MMTESALMPTSDEQWRPVVGWEALYEVSTHGQVRRDGSVLKAKVSGKSPYQYVNLCNGSLNVYSTIHRLVATAWLANPSYKPCVDHIDGVHTNNHISNLRWATRTENQQNKRSKRLFKGVSKHGNKWFAQIVIDGVQTHLATCDTPEEAYFIYCGAAVCYYGDFACG